MLELIDKAQFRAIMGDGDPVCIEIFKDFCQDSERYLEALEKFIESNDEKSILDLLHQWKGSSGTFGLSALHVAISQLEEAVKVLERTEGSELQDLMDLVGLRKLFERTVEAVDLLM